MVVKPKEPKRRSRKPVGERVTIGFATDAYERILDLAESKGVSVAKIVRDAVSDYLVKLDAKK